MRTPYPLLKMDELRALISAGREIEAGFGADEARWPDEKQGALLAALDKLAAEVRRRQEIIPAENT